MATEQIGQIVGEVVRAAVELSQRKVGALVVIERETRLDDIIASGQRLNADLSAELLTTVFHPGSTLHDQAVVVCGDQVAAASCLLPVTDDPGVGMAVHTRHRAALGMSLQSDAVVVVVSEETGSISLSYDGRLIRGLNQETLKERLMDLLQPTVLTSQRLNWRRPFAASRDRARERTERV
jgi:diadenylate cyclase